jgi:hypothetical protein
MLVDSLTCLGDSTVLHNNILICDGYEKIRRNTIIMWQICDLSSINQVKSFATKFTSMDKPLHVLVRTVVSSTLPFCIFPSCF